MAAKFLDIKQMMKAIDLRDRQWYNNLPPEEKKLYSPYMTLKWSASVNGDRFFKEHYIEMTNELVNKNLWTLSKNHKGLLWKLNAICGATVTQFHQWIYPKKKTSSTKSKMKELQAIYPNAKQQDLDLLDKTMTTKQFTELQKQHGIDK